MPAQTENRSGLLYGWNYGENGWNVGMDANMLHIGRFGFHLSVISRGVLIAPETPGVGATYIVPEDAEGEWEVHVNRVAVWNGDQWIYATPRQGWVAYIEDEEVLSAYKPTGWSTGISI